MTIFQRVRVYTLLLFIIFLTACSATKQQKSPSPEPTQIDDLIQSANHAYQRGELENAERLYLKLLNQVPEEPEYWYRLGNIYVQTNRPYAAMDLYRKAIDRRPEFAEAWYNLSLVQLKQTAFTINQMLISINEREPLYNEAATILKKITDIVAEDE